MTPADATPSRLHIYDRRERAIVSAADRLLAIGAAAARPFRRRRRPSAPRRILLLRLERIGDLLMALPAIADLRALAPDAAIDLVVGSWNRRLAEAITDVTAVRTLDAAWLSREGGGLGLPGLLRAAAAWRRERYDLAINFEPDVRSNLLLTASGAAWTAGYRSAGGGPLLDDALDYDPRAHTADNARHLVAEVFTRPAPAASERVPALPRNGPLPVLPPSGPLLTLPASARAAAAERLGAAQGPLIGLHASGGRAVKQWAPEKFGDVARRLVLEAGATIVLTGTAADRTIVDVVTRAVPARHVIDAAGDIDLLTLGALLERVDLLLTGDTGPMHLAVAVGTPVAAVFGPSDPARYAPRGERDRVIRVDLPCSPCNRIRLPPARCTGHTPDCLAGVDAERVFAAVMSILEAGPPRATPADRRETRT